MKKRGAFHGAKMSPAGLETPRHSLENTLIFLISAQIYFHPVFFSLHGMTYRGAKRQESLHLDQAT